MFKDLIIYRIAQGWAPVLMREGAMDNYLPLKCFWCGHVFHPLEAIEDHKLWCGERPADA